MNILTGKIIVYMHNAKEIDSFLNCVIIGPYCRCRLKRRNETCRQKQFERSPKMKKFMALILAVVLVASLMAGCGKSETPAATTGKPESTEKADASEAQVLRVSVQPYLVSSMVQYIKDNQLAEKAGLNVEYYVFNNGAAINEAMGEWDISITGGAFVYAMANYDCKLVGHQVDGTDGNYVCARKGDPLCDATTAEEKAECVRGKTFLTCIGTTGHYTLCKFLEYIGVSTDEVNIMNLEVANVYASWVAGEGDYAVLTEPYCYYDMDEMDTQIIDTLESVGGRLMESLVVTTDAYNNRYDDVVKFISLIYQANDAMIADPDMGVQTILDWYTNCGQTQTEEGIRTMLEGKYLIGTEEASKITLGEYAVSYASFYNSQGLISDEGLENVKNSVASDVMADALAMAKGQ